jgi:hypothetical protein
MDPLPNAPTIDLTLPSPIEKASSSNGGTLSVVAKAKIGRHGLERYYENFTEHTAGDMKGKTSATCILCKELVWHLKHSTTNYSRHLQRHHAPEFQLWSAEVTKAKSSDDKMKQTTLEGSSSPTANPNKYGSNHPRQIELTRMIFHDFIIGLDLPLSMMEKPAFVRAMATVDTKFRVPSL